MKLRITPAASAEIDGILSYLHVRSPQGAKHVGERLAAAFDTLLLNPRLGRRTSKPGVRRLVLGKYPYLVFYVLRGEDLIIIAVRHSARRPDTMPGE